jgi:hypothetical protein
MTLRFRPQQLSTKHIMRLRRQGYGNEWINYNFQSRVEWYPAGYKLNRRTISKQFQRLHYLACHAPKPIVTKYRTAYNQFCNRRFGNLGTASMRYLNTWTANLWL